MKAKIKFKNLDQDMKYGCLALIIKINLHHAINLQINQPLLIIIIIIIKAIVIIHMVKAFSFIRINVTYYIKTTLYLSFK